MNVIDSHSDQADVLKVQSTVAYALLSCWKETFITVIFILAAVYFRHTPHAAQIICIGAALFILRGCLHFFALRSRMFVISKEQIKMMTGTFSRRIDYLELYRVKDFIVHQPFLYRAFKIMNVTILSVDMNNATRSIHLNGIPVSELPSHIRDLVQAAKKQNRVYEVDRT